MVRYHSLACTHLPDELHCTAWTDDGVIMAIEHINRPVWGCSSILSPSTPSMDMRYLVILCEWRWSTTAFIICIRGAALGASQQRRLFSVGGVSNMQLVYREYPGPSHHWLCFRSAMPLTGMLSGSTANTRKDPTPDTPSWAAARLREPSVLSTALTMSASPGGPQRASSGRRRCFTLIDQIIESVQLTMPQDLPFTFKGGFVGYLGYELKALVGGRKAYCSEYPDASFIFAPHFFVFDHHCQKLYECLIGEVGQRLEWPRLPQLCCLRSGLQVNISRSCRGSE